MATATFFLKIDLTTAVTRSPIRMWATVFAKRLGGATASPISSIATDLIPISGRAVNDVVPRISKPRSGSVQPGRSHRLADSPAQSSDPQGNPGCRDISDSVLR
jgi:hypothetical protein